MSNKIIYVLHVTEPTELICEQRRLINDGFEIIDVQVTNKGKANENY